MSRKFNCVDCGRPLPPHAAANRRLCDQCRRAHVLERRRKSSLSMGHQNVTGRTWALTEKTIREMDAVDARVIVPLWMIADNGGRQ